MIKQLSFPWRNAFESYAALAWTLGAISSLSIASYSDMPSGPFWYTFAITVFFAMWRWKQTFYVWKKKACLQGRGTRLVKYDLIQNKMNLQEDSVWFGKGWEWKPQHSQQVFELLKSDIDAIKPPAFYSALQNLFDRNWIRVKKGAPWIHGLEIQDNDINIPIEYLEGHTLVFGTNGSLKTRLLDLVVSQAVMRGEVCYIIDPKGDRDLRHRAEMACKFAGREDNFFVFHPAFTKTSVRIDPLKNWTRPTELASRISALIPSETGGDAWTAFSWRAINLVTQGLIEIDERPNLRKLLKYIEGGVDPLVLETLKNYMRKNVENWELVTRPYIERAKSVKNRPSPTTPNEVIGLVAYYKENCQHAKPSGIVDGLVSMYEHNRDHFGKMVATLIPVLSMLCSGELGDLLSPDPADINDDRPILDTSKAIAMGSVVYIGLDSLSDSTVGAAIGSIVLADLTSVAGRIYNFEENPKRVNIFVDEAAEVVNVPFVQMLNKGRGAGFNVFFVAQTLPDFIAKTQNEPMARMILGNANNLIVGRIKERQTQDFVIETIGKTYVQSAMESQSTAAMGSDGDVTNFTGGYGERLTDTEYDKIPAELLGMIPDLEYIANFAGGRIFKGKIPVITD